MRATIGINIMWINLNFGWIMFKKCDCACEAYYHLMKQRLEDLETELKYMINKAEINTAWLEYKLTGNDDSLARTEYLNNTARECRHQFIRHPMSQMASFEEICMFCKKTISEINGS